MEMAEEHQDKPYIENQQQHSRGDYQHAPEKTTTAHEKDPNGGEEEGKEGRKEKDKGGKSTRDACAPRNALSLVADGLCGRR